MEIARTWFDFSGRMNRGKFWLVTIINTVIVGTAILMAVMANSWALVIVAGLIFVVLTVSGFAAGVKRLHDRNKSAWWLLLFYVAPSALQAIANQASGVEFVLGLVVIAISLWALVELGGMRGTIGVNLYGADPMVPQVLTPPVHTH